MQKFLVNQGPILAFIERTNSVVTERDFFPFPVDDEKNFALFLVLLESPEDVAKLVSFFVCFFPIFCYKCISFLDDWQTKFTWRQQS